MHIQLLWEGEAKSLDLFHMEIIQEEGCFAKAKLVVDALSPLPKLGTRGTLKEGDEILFVGVLEGAPFKVEGNFAEVLLIARPADFGDKVKALQEKVRMHPYWDPLYIHPDKVDDFEERQDVKQTSFFCDPRTGELSESGWFDGKHRLNLQGDFFEDSLRVKNLGRPLKSCTVHVHVYWIQKREGIANLSPSIRRAFPLQKVHSYTKNAFGSRWPQTGQRLGKSGIWILKSDLKEMKPPEPRFPKYSAQFQLEDEKGVKKSYRLKRFWFKPKLWVGWQAFQKRKETLKLTYTPYPDGEGDHKHIEFTLQNINPEPKALPWHAESMYAEGDKAYHKGCIYVCQKAHTSSLEFEDLFWTLKRRLHTPLEDSARASFFLTERGYLAAEHAIERAHYEIMRSSRHFEITFEGPWEKLKPITTDYSLTLKDPRLPNGEVTGKVVRYSLIAKGETGERYGVVTLHINPLEKTQPKDKAKSMVETPTGIQYLRYDEQMPPPATDGPLLKGIKLINGPLEQEALMASQTSKASLQKELGKTKTQLRFYFKDQRTKDCIEHEIVCSLA